MGVGDFVAFVICVFFCEFKAQSRSYPAFFRKLAEFFLQFFSDTAVSIEPCFDYRHIYIAETTVSYLIHDVVLNLNSFAVSRLIPVIVGLVYVAFRRRVSGAELRSIGIVLLIRCYGSFEDIYIFRFKSSYAYPVGPYVIAESHFSDFGVGAAIVYFYLNIPAVL